MKTLLKQLAFGFACTIICTGCYDMGNYEIIVTYPMDITLTDYNLPTGVTWQNMKHDSVYRIDSEEKLFQYLPSPTGVPEIDFGKYSLIIVSGINTSGIESITSQMQQTEKDKYTLSITVESHDATVVEGWNVSKLVPKLAEKANIGLILTGMKNEPSAFKKKLVGTWKEVYPCNDCSELTISNNDTIYQKFTSDNTTYKLFIQFIARDSIQIERLWESDKDKRLTKNKIIFYSNDSILIEDFYSSDAAVFPPEFIDVKLVRKV
jgi:hypothetical protein